MSADKNPSYRDLLKHLQTFTEDQLDMTVTVYEKHQDEFFPVQSFEVTGDEPDILDGNHPYISFKT